MTTEDDVLIDWVKLQDQQKHLAWLRRRSVTKLTKFHKLTFHKQHPYYQRMPAWVPRQLMERRLFYWFCARNYHLPDPFRKEFRNKAHRVLQESVNDETKEADLELVRELKEFRKFTRRGILSLPEERLDRYLTRLGYDLYHLPMDMKRQVLFELYNMHSGDIVPRYHMVSGKAVYTWQVRKPNLIQRILENPRLRWVDFRAKFKHEIPRDMKRKYFDETRCRLRKAGYTIPVIKRITRADRAILKGKHKVATERGRNIEATADHSRHQGAASLDISTTHPDEKEA